MARLLCLNGWIIVQSGHHRNTKATVLKIISPKVSSTTPCDTSVYVFTSPSHYFKPLDQVPLIITELWFHFTGPFGPSENMYYFMITTTCKLLLSLQVFQSTLSFRMFKSLGTQEWSTLFFFSPPPMFQWLHTRIPKYKYWKSFHVTGGIREKYNIRSQCC